MSYVQAFAIPQIISLIHHKKTHSKLTWNSIIAEMLHTKYLVGKGINKYMVYTKKSGETYIHIYIYMFISAKNDSQSFFEN